MKPSKPNFSLVLVCLAFAACGDDEPTAQPDTNVGDTASDVTSDVASDGADTTVDTMTDDGGDDTDLLPDVVPDLLPGDTGGEDAEPDGFEGPIDGLYGPSVNSVTIEVDYVRGAAPETSGGLTFGSPWELFETNIEALFAAHPRDVIFPTVLGDMQELPIDDTDDSFTYDEIVAIAEEYRDVESTLEDRSFYVLWLDGVYRDDSGERETVLGVSFGSTQIIAMFKPTISRFGGGFEAQVEQTTLVHEVGHAAGLVNARVPMVEPHQDEEHGAHCTNTNCVMYWTIEGADISSFVAANVLGSSSVLFGPECLEDVEAAASAE
jgi:hypothetical protein